MVTTGGEALESVIYDGGVVSFPDRDTVGPVRESHGPALECDVQEETIRPSHWAEKSSWRRLTPGGMEQIFRSSPERGGQNLQNHSTQPDRIWGISHGLERVESGIRHLHSLGLIHNDINPSNIMLDGEIPIIDFGSCQREGESLEGIAVPTDGLKRRFRLPFPRTTWMRWKKSVYG